MTPSRTLPEVHFQPKLADSSIFLVQKGILAPIEESDGSSSSDSEEDSPQSHKNFPRPVPAATQAPLADAPEMAFSDCFVHVLPHVI